MQSKFGYFICLVIRVSKTLFWEKIIAIQVIRKKHVNTFFKDGSLPRLDSFAFIGYLIPDTLK